MPDRSLQSALSEARALLQPGEPRRESVWPTLAAAGFFAVSALVFAAAAILAPPAQLAPAATSSAHITG
jgi:hypothetical protein